MKTSLRCLSAALLLGCFAAHADGLFMLQSPEFADNALLNKKYAGNAKDNPNCIGQNVSPAVVWSNAPAATQSYALVLHDPEGAKGLGVTHLIAYSIAASVTGFAANELRDGKGFTGGKNTPGTFAYYGPCPPPGSGAHHYTWTLIATDLPVNALAQGLTREQLFEKLKGHSLAAAGLISRFGQ